MVERFVFRPETLLGDYRDGGPSMIYRVLIISASSRAALPFLSKQVPRGNVRQRQAIAAGMATAAYVCDGRSSEQVRAIERVSRDITDVTFQREYRARYEDFRAKADAEIRERAIADALMGVSRPEEAGRNTLFSPRETGPIQSLGAVAPIPSTLPPIR